MPDNKVRFEYGVTNVAVFYLVIHLFHIKNMYSTCSYIKIFIGKNIFIHDKIFLGDIKYIYLQNKYLLAIKIYLLLRLSRNSMVSLHREVVSLDTLYYPYI